MNIIKLSIVFEVENGPYQLICLEEVNVNFETSVYVGSNSSTYNVLLSNTLLGSNPIMNGDLIGAFYLYDGILFGGGYAIYDGSLSLEITLLGDNPQTPFLEGFIDGQDIIWIIQQTQTGVNNLIDENLVGNIFLYNAV